jgi:hypothetical protein
MSIWRSPDLGLANELAQHLVPPRPEPLGQDVWRLQVLDERGCARLSAVIDDHLSWCRGDHASPNSMHSAGVVMKPLGLSPAMAALRRGVIEQLATEHFPELGPLDHQYAFAATYGQGLDRSLGFHADDSEITLNLCLGHDFDGGTLVFLGRRCAAHRQTPHRADEELRVDLLPGQAVLHAGAHRHLVTPVRGERRNLILWARSAAYRASASADAGCPPWCGRRKQGAPG